MKLTPVETSNGVAGTGTRIDVEWKEGDDVDKQATLCAWFLTCPGQSPAWHDYILSCIHLREIEGGSDVFFKTPDATHEIMLYALDPTQDPTIDDMETWHYLRPINFWRQVKLNSDDDARHLVDLCAQAVLDGHLWAEPPLSGQTEPWTSTVEQTAEHLRTGGHN